MPRLLIVNGNPLGSEPRLNMFIRHLPSFGWDVRSVGGFRLRRGGGVSNHLFNLVGLEDLSFLQIPLLLSAALREARSFNPDAFLVSCPPFSGAILGAELKWRLGLPYILDYRDPWFFNETRWHVSRLHDWWYRRLESHVDSYPDMVLFVGDEYVSTYERLFRRGALCVRNGFDSEDFEGPERFRNLTFAWVGTLWNDCDLSWLEGFLRACDEKIWFRDECELLIVGNVFPRALSRIRSMIGGYPVRILGRVPSGRAHAIIAGAHCLFYSGYVGAGKRDLASRVYEFASLGRMVIVVTEDTDSEFCRVVGSEPGIRSFFVMRSSSAADEVKERCLDVWRIYARGFRPLPRVHDYSMKAVVRRLSLYLDALVR